LLIGPGIEPGVDDRTSSQLDIAPTIIDFCGWPIGHTSLGNSLLAPAGANGTPAQGMAIMATEHEVLRKQGSQWLLHNLNKRLDGSADVDEAQLTELEQSLLAMVQAVHKLLGANKIMPASD
jgi:phosphoglycerol transferase MdoB-like AlkP superfamily enzyme